MQEHVHICNVIGGLSFGLQYQCLPYSSSGITLFGMITVQADSCLNSDTLCISVRGQEGVLGGGHFGPET